MGRGFFGCGEGRGSGELGGFVELNLTPNAMLRATS